MRVKLLILVLLILATSNAKATTFHGDTQRTGNFNDTGPKTADFVHKVGLTGFVDGSPIVWNGNVYLTNNPGMAPNSEQLGVYCINATNGSVVWKVPNIYSMATPAVNDKGHLFVHAYKENVGGVLCSFYAVNGTERWCVPIEADPDIGWWYISSSPVVYNGKIYVLSYDGKLHCFDLNGNEMWNISSNGVNTKYFSSPSASFGLIFYPRNNSGTYYLTAVNESGVIVWNRVVDGIITNTPAVSNNIVYIATDSKLYAFNIDGVEVWNISFNGEMSTPAIANGMLFIGSKDGKLYCFNATTGEEIWNYTAITNPSSWDSIKSSPAFADSVIYFATNEANGSVFALNSSNGELIWKYNIGQYIMSSPFVYKNKLFIGADDGNLYIFGIWKGIVELNPSKMTIELKNGNTEQINGNTALAALIKSSEIGEFNVTVVNSTWGLYVESIADVQPQGWNGWMYVVNGVMPNVSAADYTLNDGDVVEFFYGSWGISPNDAEYRVIIQVNLTNVIWNGTVELKQGNFTVVTNGTSYEVNNLTALGALNAASLVAGFNYTVSDEWYESWGSLLVNSIYGIENNGTSGWMYWVNYPDEPMPMTGANVYPIKNGDVVYWYYSTSMNDTPNNSPYVVRISIKTENVSINSFTVSEGNRGGNAMAWVNLTAFEEGWYVIVVSGTNNGEGIAGISTAYLNLNEPLNIPVLVVIPQQVPTGDYKLYVGIYKLDDYPDNIIKWYGYQICEVN